MLLSPTTTDSGWNLLLASCKELTYTSGILEFSFFDTLVAVVIKFFSSTNFPFLVLHLIQWFMLRCWDLFISLIPEKDPISKFLNIGASKMIVDFPFSLIADHGKVKWENTKGLGAVAKNYRPTLNIYQRWN